VPDAPEYVSRCEDVSYGVNITADQDFPTDIAVFDRNWVQNTPGMPDNWFTTFVLVRRLIRSPNNATGVLSPAGPWEWTADLHDSVGNHALTDGSVNQTVTGAGEDSLETALSRNIGVRSQAGRTHYYQVPVIQ